VSVLLDFFLTAHDPLLVPVAALVCLISSYACVSLMRHARRTEGWMRHAWVGVAALAVGFGIWATHFIAVLAYRPGFELGYDLWMTVLSAMIAIVISGTGIALAVAGGGRWDRLLGGAVVGIGISSMHYVGMASLVIGGNIGWNGGLVATSIIAGMALGATAVFVGTRRGLANRLAGAGILTLAICAMHFTAMGAADFSLCFPIAANAIVDKGLISTLIATVSIVILGVALAAALLDEADRRRTAREAAREAESSSRIREISHMLDLATTHMSQALCLFDADGVLRFHNDRLPTLFGAPPGGPSLVGTRLHELLDMIVPQLSQDPARQANDDKAGAVIPDMAAGALNEYTHTLDSGRVLRVVHTPIGDGSWVTTVDDITAQQRSQDRIQHLAYHDHLTGLLNRAAFAEHLDIALEDALDGDFNFAVVAIDLDRFKDINDSYGHMVGDHVLKALATRLTMRTGDGEVFARLGGDEFAAIKRFSDMDDLREFLGRVENALHTRVETGGQTINTAASIGVAVWPDDGDDRTKLLTNADLAMYRAKNDFDRRVTFYESDMDEHARQRRAMANDLWTALEVGGFSLVYQVQKSVSSGEITGYEVLLRWDRPGHGPVSPADFIPVAEETGAIGAIGNWVLRNACAEAASWPEPYKIAVNVSGVQLSQVELIDTVRQTLFDTGLAPSRLELEVTETSIIADKKRALHILRQIKAMGVSIAIDDFGTGYSSLDTLRSFPFDKIKLDRSFMNEVERDEQSKAIVRAILALGRSLAVPVLAEGVETQEQLDVLRHEGCNEAQGFLLGRPGALDWDDVLEPLIGLAS
jgi:diguanylate cyclase (GGDEF)-like protein